MCFNENFDKIYTLQVYLISDETEYTLGLPINKMHNMLHFILVAIVAFLVCSLFLTSKFKLPGDQYYSSRSIIIDDFKEVLY